METCNYIPILGISWSLRVFFSYTSRLYFYWGKSYYINWIHSDNMPFSNFENQCLYYGSLYNAGDIFWCNGNNQIFMISWDALCFYSLGHWLWKKQLQNTEHCTYIKLKIFISFYIYMYPISWVPFERMATFNFLKVCSDALWYDYWKNVSILKGHCIYFYMMSYSSIAYFACL